MLSYEKSRKLSELGFKIPKDKVMGFYVYEEKFVNQKEIPESIYLSEKSDVERADMDVHVYYRDICSFCGSLTETNDDGDFLCDCSYWKDYSDRKFHEEPIPTTDADGLWDIIPSYIKNKNDNIYHKAIEPSLGGNATSSYIRKVKTEGWLKIEELNVFCHNTITESLGAMLIWLVENKFVSCSENPT